MTGSSFFVSINREIITISFLRSFSVQDAISTGSRQKIWTISDRVVRGEKSGGRRIARNGFGPHFGANELCGFSAPPSVSRRFMFYEQLNVQLECGAECQPRDACVSVYYDSCMCYSLSLSLPGANRRKREQCIGTRQFHKSNQLTVSIDRLPMTRSVIIYSQFAPLLSILHRCYVKSNIKLTLEYFILKS